MSIIGFAIMAIKSCWFGIEPATWQAILWFFLYILDEVIAWCLLTRKKPVYIVNAKENAALICKILNADKRGEIYAEYGNEDERDNDS